MVPFEKQLDTKGIEAIHKSSKPLSTRKALKKILLEDISNLHFSKVFFSKYVHQELHRQDFRKMI
jgi:hypothetical protein